jgi:hypothetical protein
MLLKRDYATRFAPTNRRTSLKEWGCVTLILASSPQTWPSQLLLNFALPVYAR